MKDVAEKAGVTIGTVSNVINHTAGVSEKTNKKVLDAIRVLDYVPNSIARNMRLKKNHLVGLLIPNLTNNFHSRMASSFVDCAEKDGYTVLILGYEYSLEREKKALKILYENNVGTIVIANGSRDEKAIQKYMNQGIRFVLADRRTELPGVSYVEFDNVKIMHEIIGMLHKKGYSRIGFISEPLNLTNLTDRYKGYKEAMKHYGHEFKEEDVFVSERLCLNNIENGYLYMDALLKENKKEKLPEVFIISSDLQAIGAEKAILDHGYRIPEDFAIVGCDNLKISNYVSPRLTTINQDRVLLGERLWNLVKSKNENMEIENITLQQSLVMRESC